MSIYKIKYIRFLCAFLLGVNSFVFADLELLIGIIPQKHAETCWAATCRMVLDPYGYPQSETALLNYATNGQAIENCLYGSTNNRCCNSVLSHFGNITAIGRSAPLSFEDVVTEINGGRPILVRRTPTALTQHISLIVGYRYNPNRLIINDPEPVNQGSQKTILYDEFVEDPDNTTIRWTHSLRLTSDPSTPIPTPVNPPPSNWMIVYYDGTWEISPSMSSLSYRAVRNFSNSGTWNWKLVFLHNDGYCTARSWTVTGSTSQSIDWDITNFTMPTGYNWLYCYNGKVPGRVEATFTYNGTTLKHSKDVMFVPYDLYPGSIFYKDEVVSNSQSDVKAHTEILLEDDLFNSGANVDFISGNCIKIYDGVTINSGSNIHFKIDQSVW